jgi:hypothetical protein
MAGWLKNGELQRTQKGAVLAQFEAQLGETEDSHEKRQSG